VAHVWRDFYWAVCSDAPQRTVLAADYSDCRLVSRVMVQPDVERQLDSLILDVFEQAVCPRTDDSQLPRTDHDDHAAQFYFPVTSQTDARAFVGEMERRGVQYSKISAIVGKFCSQRVACSSASNSLLCLPQKVLSISLRPPSPTLEHSCCLYKTASNSTSAAR